MAVAGRIVVGASRVPTVNENSYRWPAEVFDHDTTVAVQGQRTTIAARSQLDEG